MKIIHWIIIIVIVIVIYFVWKYYFKKKQLNKHFYTEQDINQPFLNNIKNISPQIKNEIMSIDNPNHLWYDWPEKWLYDDVQKEWKVMPFYAFGTWSNKNLKKCPVLAEYLKSIPNIKLALISKMSPNLTLNKHQGWGFYSNHVIRCHYGIHVPENCFVIVEDNGKVMKKFHKENEWLIFDDSKIHSASNLSNENRIVLIIDIERPNNIEPGVSAVGDTSELQGIIDAMKKDSD